MDTKAFEYVSAIVRCGSLSKASEELYVSQPALSQYISKLEENYGVNLFLRENRKLQLTPAGELFLQEGNKVLNLCTNLEHRLQNMKQEETFCIHLGISQFYSRFYLPHIIPSFLEKYPHVRFSITEAQTPDLELMLQSGKLDVCLLPMYLLNDTLEYHIIYNEEMLLAVPPASHINAFASGSGNIKKMDLKYLRSEKFIMLSKFQHFSALARKICEANGFEPDVICEVINWETLNLLVQQGMGVGFVTELIASGSPSAPLYYRIMSEEGLIRPYAIACNKTQKADIVSAFVQHVCDLASQKVIPR